MFQEHHYWTNSARKTRTLTPPNCDRTQGTLVVQVQDCETAQKIRRLTNQLSTFFTRRYHGRSGQLKYSPPRKLDRVKISARSTQSQTQSSSELIQVHREECNPPYRRLNKVRNNKSTCIRSNPSVSLSSGHQWRIGSHHQICKSHSTTQTRGAYVPTQRTILDVLHPEEGVAENDTTFTR